MGTSLVIINVLNQLATIQKDEVIANPKPSNNSQKTQSNVNKIFKMINVWNDNIDNEILSTKEGIPAIGTKGYAIKCPSVFVEFVPGDGNQILGGVTQYMDAAMYFHIFSDQLATSNLTEGLIGINPGDLIDANFEIDYLRDVITSNFLGFHTYNGSAFMSRYDKLDYKHGTITKWLRGFHFCFNDVKGSIFDKKSSRYLTPVQLNNATLSVTAERDWISGNEYISGLNVVWFAGLGAVLAGFYLCLTTNTDSVFTASKWQYLPIWQANFAYAVNTYIYNGLFCYKCSIANNDAEFNFNNWELIVRI